MAGIIQPIGRLEMSALGDALLVKNREYVLKCKISIAVDSTTDDDTATYSILLEAPELSETLLEGQTAGETAAALTEFTDWVTAQW
jgi:uncharacterized membrane-anchored protein